MDQGRLRVGRTLSLVVLGVMALAFTTAAASVEGTLQQPGPVAVYEVTFTLTDYSNPSPDPGDGPEAEESGPVEFTGVCDGEGDCSMSAPFPTVTFDYSPLEEIVLDPDGDGSYSASVVRPVYFPPGRDDRCGMAATTDVTAVFDGDTVSGTYSYVPDDGGLARSGRRVCYEQTVEYSFDGVRTSGASQTAGSAELGSESEGGTSPAVLVGTAVAAGTLLIAAFGAVRRRRRSKDKGRESSEPPEVRAVHDPGEQSITPSGPPTVLGIRAVADTQPLITIERTGGE